MTSIVIIALVLASIITIFLIKQRFSKSIMILLRAMDKISEGDLSYRIPEDKSLGDLANRFNQMMRDLRVSEGKAQQLSQMLSRLTDGIEEEIMLFDAKQKISWTNKKVRDALGLKEEEILGKYCYQLMHKMDCFEEGKDSSCPLTVVKKTGRPFRLIQDKVNPEGGILYKECTIYPLYDQEGNLNEYVHIIHDITERISLEEKLKSNISALEAAQVDLRKKMKELEKFHKVSVDRELKMAELKRKITELQAAINK